MAAAKTKRARSSCFRFLVLSLSMDNRCNLFDGILANAFPDAHHIATGGIDDLTTAFLNLFQRDQIGSKSRDDHHVLRAQFVDLGLAAVTKQVLYPERRNLLVYERVVNDFTQDEEATSGKDLARCVCEIDRPLDAV